MRSEQDKKIEAGSANPSTPEASGEGTVAAAKNAHRRQLLKAGLLAAPFVLTFKSQPVWALQEMHVSGASPWYRGPWNSRGDVIKDGTTFDGTAEYQEENILKYRNAADAPASWMGPVGGSDESGITR